MKEVFKKIKERLEEASWSTISTFDEDGYSNDDSEEVITLDKAIKIVNQVEEEYNKQNINQDLTIVESLPSLYPLQPFEVEAIHRVVERAKYSNGWIPCSERLPEENVEVLVTIKEIDGDCYTRSTWVQEGEWIIKKTPLNPIVIAWRPLPTPYKGEQA